MLNKHTRLNKWRIILIFYLFWLMWFFGYLTGYSLLNFFNFIFDWLATLTAYPGNAYLIIG